VAVPIPFPELRALLDDQVVSVQTILGRDLIGFYIVGSFAVGDADLSSDCDFITVV
jgi:predicted nucleotidyltransferase